jgi:hypothetical protein
VPDRRTGVVDRELLANRDPMYRTRSVQRKVTVQPGRRRELELDGWSPFRQVDSALEGSSNRMVATCDGRKLSILIPVYNEGATIDRVLRSIVAAELPLGIEREVVVINDGSTDRTETELETFRQAHPAIAMFYHHERVNHGKGWCLRRGIRMATGDYIVIQDADLEYDPADHAVMLGPILEDRADVVYGSRFLNGAPVTTRRHRTVNRA